MTRSTRQMAGLLIWSAIALLSSILPVIAKDFR